MYIVIIVEKPEDKKPIIEFDDLKIEYVCVGDQFHGKSFKGKRPTHVIDYASILDWSSYFMMMTEGAKLK